MEADRPAIYRPRKQASPLWQCVSRHLPAAEREGHFRVLSSRNEGPRMPKALYVGPVLATGH